MPAAFPGRGGTPTRPGAGQVDRYGRLLDHYGHHWSVATRLRDMSPQEMMAAMGACMA